MRQENPIPPGGPGVRADLECWTDAIEGLHQAVGRVLKAPSAVSAAPLRAAVRRIGEEALSAGSPGKFAELTGVPAAQWLSFRRWLSAPSVQASAGQTIGWLAWAQREARLPESEFELLLFAAALKDCGLLLLESQYKMSEARLAVERPEPWKSHPLHSAGVAGGLADVPRRVADLVATHHERLDGTGFPHELPAKSQGELSRYFGVVCRFVDLFQKNALGTTSEENAASTGIEDTTVLPEDVWSAGLELQQEVRYGCWDAQWAGAFLNGIVSGLQDRLDELLSDPGQQRQLVLRRRLRRDAAHEGPEPRLARLKSTSETARKKT